MEGLNIGRFTNVSYAAVETDCNVSVIFDFDEGLPQEELDAALNRLEESAHAEGWEIDPEQTAKYITIAPNYKNPDDFTADIVVMVHGTDGESWDFETLEGVITREEGQIMERIALAYIRAEIEAYFIRRENREHKTALSA